MEITCIEEILEAMIVVNVTGDRVGDAERRKEEPA